MTGPVPWVKRVRVADYRSVARADVHLGPLTILIGPNGAGKSNILDDIDVAVPWGPTPERR